VFVVGYLGDARRATAVLFEPESVSGDTPPRKKARKDIAGTLGARTSAGGGLGTDFDLDGGVIAFTCKDYGADTSDISPTLRSMEYDGSHANGGGQVAVAFSPSAVRRLTPRECERLQGFPDDYTLVPYRNKPAADGPRYRALGNSMAVPVMAFIGRRVQMVEELNGALS
jgi:DNA (cytosine-5)-methyltransferase 1